jgi:NAD-dependent SIR2 family protein deacetylase
MNNWTLEAAARMIQSAEALVIAAGAGMGVDSGLPDFRGNEGFWKAYPPFAKLGLSFIDLANPRWFASDPALAWGFYGHRLQLYRRTRPHEGFQILKKWGTSKPRGYFVFTSNVDGQFQRAGLDQQHIHEVHGAIDFL